jgi:hypothetical protein
MEWQQLLSDGYERILSSLERILDGLSPEDLDQQPKPDCNSMGWMAWHLTRGGDAQISALVGEEQLWIKDKWCEKFNRPADPADTGFRHSTEQVAAFKSPEVKIFLDYQRAVLERAKQYFSTLSASDLDRELNEPWFQPLPTVGVRLVSVMVDCLEHVGQIAYVRGLLKGKGWSNI